MRAIDLHVHVPTEEWLRNSIGPHLEATEAYFRQRVQRRSMDEVAEEYRSRDLLGVVLDWDDESVSGRGWLGAGYLNVQLATFRDTHLNDNLSAIHIFAPFGFVGALGVLALLAALALAPLAVFFAGNSDGPERAIDQRTALGIMALWTFSIAGIYMFAANAGAVLFTGKNVYLLAAASKSDAIEGGVLLLLALLALTPSKAVTTKPLQVAP